MSILEVCRQGVTTAMASTTQTHSDLLVDQDDVPVIGEQDRSDTSSQDDAVLLVSCPATKEINCNNNRECQY